MFLVGGPAYSGTTLLAHLLNQGDVVCLDEPDFHLPDSPKSRRGIPFLQELFPEAILPDMPLEELSFADAVSLIEECERALAPRRLGTKTCNKLFVNYAHAYRRRGYPVVAIVRDIRDALIRPLPDFVGGEAGLRGRYQNIWKQRRLFDRVVRYEDLVTNPRQVLQGISETIDHPFEIKDSWDPESVARPMFKAKRHELLKSGEISTSRVGIWQDSGRTFSNSTHRLARRMGYK